MTNVKTVPNCPNCKTIGTVIKNKNNVITLECPDCKLNWNTISFTCPFCKNPNGYATKGICSKCYSDGHRS